jgi:hypothetical protein
MSWYFFHCSHKRGTLWGGVPRGSRHRQLLPAVFHHQHLHLLEIQVGTQANHVFAVWLSSRLLPRQVSQKLTDVSKVRTNSITAMETRLQDATSQKTFIFLFFQIILNINHSSPLSSSSMSLSNMLVFFTQLRGTVRNIFNNDVFLKVPSFKTVF